MKNDIINKRQVERGGGGGGWEEGKFKEGMEGWVVPKGLKIEKFPMEKIAKTSVLRNTFAIFFTISALFGILFSPSNTIGNKLWEFVQRTYPRVDKLS